MTEKEFIRIESRFKKEELPGELVNIVKLKIGFKKALIARKGNWKKLSITLNQISVFCKLRLIFPI